MKKILPLLTMLALAACNNDANTNPVSETKVSEEVAKNAAEPERLGDLMIMPFGLPMAPDTRIHGLGIAQYFIGDLYHEANGVLATKGNPKDIVDFYEKALKDRGFRIFSKSTDPDKPSIAAKRDSTKDYFSFSAISRSREKHDLEEGENGLRVLFKNPSLDRKK